MIGLDDSAEEIGVIPSAISWLYQLIEDQKQVTGARFSVRVSAVELTGRQQTLRDLLPNDDARGLYTVTANETGILYYICMRFKPLFFRILIMPKQVNMDELIKINIKKYT